MRIDIWDEGEYGYRASYGFRPNIRTYVHEDEEKRDCMLVIPGGGYCVVTPHEGELVAKKFYDLGFNTFVLTYTTDITMSVPLKKQPMKDAARAVRVIRDKFAKDCKLVVAGFSAGGHVVGSLITHFAEIEDKKYSDISCRPDAAIFGYPVITTGEYTHHWSVVALLGNVATDEELEYFSVEKNISSDTPPCFIWQTLGDSLVPVENSYLFAEALRKAKVNYAQYVFPFGDHGLSIASPDQFFWKGGEYSMEQLHMVLEHVKDNTLVNVPERRRNELVEQFLSEKTQEPPKPEGGFKLPESNPFADINMWPELAFIWMSRLFNA